MIWWFCLPRPSLKSSSFKPVKSKTRMDCKLRDTSLQSHYGHSYFIVIRINCDLNVMWKVGRSVGTESFKKLVSFTAQDVLSSCTKSPYTCEHSPFSSLTAKCTAHKCSSSVLYVYLILLLLLFKEKSGESYCKREEWTNDAPSQLNRYFSFFALFC